MKSVLIDLTGHRVGRVQVLRRAEDMVLSSGRALPAWLCRCDCGTEWSVVGQSLRRQKTRSCGCLNRDLMAEVGRRNRKSGQISYSAAHRRVRAARGSAREQACIDCGDQAREWSYNRSDPEEWSEPHPRTGRPVAYSGSPTYYEPRCSRCHQAFDNGSGRG